MSEPERCRGCDHTRREHLNGGDWCKAGALDGFLAASRCPCMGFRAEDDPRPHVAFEGGPVAYFLAGKHKEQQ